MNRWNGSGKGRLNDGIKRMQWKGGLSWREKDKKKKRDKRIDCSWNSDIDVVLIKVDRVVQAIVMENNKRKFSGQDEMGR